MKTADINPQSETIRAVARFMAEQDLFARHLGIQLVDLKAGHSQVRLRLAPHMVNGLGIPHGAVIFALADFAFATASNSYGTAAVALSMDVHFLNSPQPGSELIAEATEIRRTHRTGLYRIQVTDINGGMIAELHGMAYRKGTNFLDG